MARPCRSCGGRQAPPDPTRGIEGHWSLQWPHGPFQKFTSEDAARAYQARYPRKNLVLFPPANTVIDDA